MMGERYNIHSQLEHLQSKYIGTGHSDTNKWEWLTNQHRDSYASYMGHFDVLNFFAIAENESKARIRFNLMERMLQPCGPPPERPDDWSVIDCVILWYWKFWVTKDWQNMDTLMWMIGMHVVLYAVLYVVLKFQASNLAAEMQLVHC